MNELILILCLAAACGAQVYAWKCLSLAERLPLLIFSGSYLVTSVIGATLIGLGGVEYLEALGSGLNTSHIRQVGDGKYWLLIYLPLIVPPLIVAQFCRGSRTRGAEQQRSFLPSDFCFPVAYTCILAGATLYCVYSMISGGFDVSLSSWSQLSGEFAELMFLRGQIMDSVSFLFFKFVYVGLPALSIAALYQLRKHRSLTWWVLFLATFLITCWLSLATIQKAILLIYLVSICIALIELRVASHKHMAVAAVVVCVALTVMQQFFQEQWGLKESLRHITHRLAVSSPFYTNIYPEVIPYSGLDCGLWIVGVGTQPTDNLDVFQIMYPELTRTTGHAAAPAHLRLYSQCGLPGAIGSLIFVSCWIGGVMWLRRQVSGPISFAIYIQTIIVIYYATQVSLIDLYLSSYGMIWCGLTLIPLWAWSCLVHSRPRKAGATAPQLPARAMQGERVPARATT